MDGTNLLILAAAVLIAAGMVLVWRPLRCAWREARFAEARRDFHRQRERLEAKFVQLGMINAAQGGPHWGECQFDDDVAYARNRTTGELSAFVAVTIEVEQDNAVGHGSGDAIGNLRAATAVFRFDGDHWDTDGRAIFNLTPTQAIDFYRREFEMVGQEIAQRT
ncbi:MAG TPA: hypothetical protein EYP56_08430 [Planctomycetaceae bacterium]|nr:hypothetical protein [Planctomycetaceae bacterium]